MITKIRSLLRRLFKRKEKPPMTREEFRRSAFASLGEYLDGLARHGIEDESIAVDVAAFYCFMSATMFSKLSTSSARKFQRMAQRSWTATRIAAGAVEPPISDEATPTTPLDAPVAEDDPTVLDVLS